MKFSALLTACIISALFIAGPVGVTRAMGSGGGGGNDSAAASKANPYLAAGKTAIDGQKWTMAIEQLTKAVAEEPKNADAHNYLGYAYRKSGNYDQAFSHYKQALAINPDHRGAHEYIGEAYLETNDLASAQKHLDALDDLCLFGCKEYTELKDRIAAYKAKQSS
jgi:tetratricopeptide (TPR) repeat protein